MQHSQKQQIRIEFKPNFADSFPLILSDFKLKAMSAMVRVFVKQSERQGFTLEEILQGFSGLAHQRGLGQTSFFLDEASYESVRASRSASRKRKGKQSNQK